MAERFADLVRRRHRSLQLGYADDLNGRIAHWVCQLHRDEVQTEHAHERVEQGMKNMGWIAATPNGRKSEQADKIANAPLKALDLSGGMFGLCFHG
ncbi:MAG: hypothetical protein WA604_10215 [Candidatus Sulfotelmatobacter sp.]